MHTVVASVVDSVACGIFLRCRDRIQEKYLLVFNLTFFGHKFCVRVPTNKW
jgi:hypothetical protein